MLAALGRSYWHSYDGQELRLAVIDLSLKEIKLSDLSIVWLVETFKAWGLWGCGMGAGNHCPNLHSLLLQSTQAAGHPTPWSGSPYRSLHAWKCISSAVPCCCFFLLCPLWPDAFLLGFSHLECHHSPLESLQSSQLLKLTLKAGDEHDLIHQDENNFVPLRISPNTCFLWNNFTSELSAG